MKQPLLSICIPVFNCHEHIAEAVDSVLQQSFTDFELIIVDNCSDDGTYEILSGYKDCRIRLLRNETNIGACGNWNRALKEASGRYIKILCADDIIYADCLARQFALLETSDEKVVMVSCNRDIIDESGKKVFHRKYPGSSGKVEGVKVIKKIVRHGTNIVGDVSSAMFKRDVVSKAGQFDGSLPYVIDLDYWVRILLHGDLFVMTETLSAYRISAASWSVAISNSQTTDFRSLIDRIESKYGVELTTFDKLLGKFMARLNTLLRKIFYILYL